MEKRKPTWGSVRSKLSQAGYMYRMRLGNPASISDNQSGQHRPSSPTQSSNVQPRLPTEQSPPRRVPKSMLDADRAPLERHTVCELLDQLNLGQAFKSGHGPDANAAIEFLLRCYAPFIIHRRHRTVRFELRDLLDRVMLHDDMFAKALVMWASDMRDRFGPDPGGAGEVLLTQRNAVLRELRKRISSAAACSSSSVVWTVLLLVGTELLHDSIEAMGTHLGALRHIIHLRGGVDSPSLSKWVKIFLLQFERFLNYRQFVHVRSTSFEGMSPVVEHPCYPFPPNFGDRLAELPLGFTELFCNNPMSWQILNLVERMNRWTQRISDIARADKAHDADQSVANAMTLDSFCAFDLLQQDKLGATQRLLVLGMFSFCIFMNDEVVYSVMEWALRLHCMALVTKHMEPIEGNVRDSMIWVAATLIATGGHSSPAWQLGGRVYRACGGAHSSIQAITQTSQRYFWHTDLTERLRVAAVDSTRGGTPGDTV